MNTLLIVGVATVVYLATGVFYARAHLMDSYQQGERSRTHSLKVRYTTKLYGKAFAEEKADDQARMTRNWSIRMDILFWPFIGIAALLRRWFAAPVTRHNERIAQLRADIATWEADGGPAAEAVLTTLRERLAELDGK